jgi:glycosyltransferase involved in cell wall biosynthesis
LTDEAIVGYYQKCQAVIFPTEEDFGIVPLEAQACGKPVIAYRKGGATETIIEGITGEFFENQTVESLKSVLSNYKPEKYSPTDCRNQAEKFSKVKFMQEFMNMINSCVTNN